MLEVTEVAANVQAGTFFVHTQVIFNLSVPFVAVGKNGKSPMRDGDAADAARREI